MLRTALLALSVCTSTTAFQLLPLRPPASHHIRQSPYMIATSTSSDAAEVEATPPAPPPAWIEQLNKVSNFASLLCAIDCTVFPVLLAVLPLINVAGPSAAWLHKAAHAVALYFVAPVGGAAVVTNALQHRKPLVFGWGLSGVALVLLANVHLPHALEHLIPSFHAVEHWLHAKHSIINVAGCVLLLSSQWYSKRLLEKMGKCCGHDHGHGHSHDH